MPAEIVPPAEEPDAEYPFVLTTGRQLEHWHTGVDDAARRACSTTLEPEAMRASTRRRSAPARHPRRRPVRVTTRRGAIELKARADGAVAAGMVFIPFAYAEAAANMLTNPQLDPFGKIPEFKFCAVKIGRAHGDEPHVPMPDINVTASGL